MGKKGKGKANSSNGDDILPDARPDPNNDTKDKENKPRKTSEPPSTDFHVFGHFLFSPKEGGETHITPFAFSEEKAQGIIITTHGIRRLSDAEVCVEIEKFKREVADKRKVAKEVEAIEKAQAHSDFKSKQAEAKAASHAGEGPERPEGKTDEHEECELVEMGPPPGPVAPAGPAGPPSRMTSQPVGRTATYVEQEDELQRSETGGGCVAN